MFVKVYTYHIKKDKIETFLNIQEKTREIYSKYIDSHVIYIQSNEEQTKWMEISQYKDEVEYNKSIEIINRDKKIQELFKSFQEILIEKAKSAKKILLRLEKQMVLSSFSINWCKIKQEHLGAA